MEWGVAAAVMMVVMMGAMFFGVYGMHKKHKEHKQEHPVVQTSTVTAQGVNVTATDQTQPAHEALLDAGRYMGKVLAIVCGSCAAQIEQTLGRQPGIEAVTVDASTHSVRFTVKAGTTVKLADLQVALKQASDKMGMGADYRLLEVQKIILSPAAEPDEHRAPGH